MTLVASATTQSLAMSLDQTVVFPALPGNNVFGANAPNGVARVQVNGSFMGTAIFEETLDGLNWFASPFAFADAAPTQGVPVIGPTGGTFTVKMPGSVALRVRCTTSGSGSANVLVVIVEGSDIGLNPFASSASVIGNLVFPTSGTGNPYPTAASLSNTQLIGANGNRFALSIVNRTAQGTLFITTNGSAASLTNYNYAIGPGSNWQPPLNYTGAVYGIWDVADGSAITTEYV